MARGRLDPRELKAARRPGREGAWMRRLAGIVLLAICASGAACTSDGGAMQELFTRAERVAVEFVTELSKGNYNSAYKLASTELRDELTVEQMREGFEGIVPFEPGADRAVAVERVTPDWTGRRLGDVGWYFVAVTGEDVNDIVSLVVTLERGELRIRSLEFGRL
jgi:hypothetical protein